MKRQTAQCSKELRYSEKIALLLGFWRRDPAALMEASKWFFPIVAVLYFHQLNYFGDYTALILDPLFVFCFWQTNSAVKRHLDAARRAAVVRIWSR